jgi:hypothetical protein
MRLYMILYDGRQYPVEAESFGLAIEIWTKHMREEDLFRVDDEDPDSVGLVHDGSVLR